jgi:fluoride exporter
MNTLWVGLGGAVGSIARYHVGVWLDRPGRAMPWGTLAVNLAGSFLIALLLQLALRHDAITPTMRLALATGVLGGFTTYSTFNQETLRMAQQGSWGAAAAYVAITLLGGLAAGAAGWAIGRAL